MGRIAAHTGQEVTYEEILNSEIEYAPNVAELTGDTYITKADAAALIACRVKKPHDTERTAVVASKDTLRGPEARAQQDRHPWNSCVLPEEDHDGTAVVEIKQSIAFSQTRALTMQYPCVLGDREFPA